MRHRAGGARPVAALNPPPRWCVCALLVLGGVACARAQVSGSVAVLSDYRYRGASLDGERPALQLNLSWDTGSGAYAGIFASNVRFDDAPHGALQGIAYAGYAGRLDSGWVLEAGAEYSAFTRHRARDYPELYAGLIAGEFSARLSWSPHYFGQEAVAYGEVNATHPLDDDWRLLLHFGVLDVLGGHALRYGHEIVDARIGAAFDWKGGTLDAGWTDSSRETPLYPFAHDDARRALVFSYSRPF